MNNKGVRFIVDGLLAVLFLGLLMLPISFVGMSGYRSVGNSNVLGDTSKNSDSVNVYFNSQDTIQGNAPSYIDTLSDEFDEIDLVTLETTESTEVLSQTE